MQCSALLRQGCTAFYAPEQPSQPIELIVRSPVYQAVTGWDERPGAWPASWATRTIALSPSWRITRADMPQGSEEQQTGTRMVVLDTGSYRRAQSHDIALSYRDCTPEADPVQACFVRHWVAFRVADSLRHWEPCARVRASKMPRHWTRP